MSRSVYTAKAHQLQSSNHLLDVPRCALFAPMGSGKTVSSYTALDIMFLTGAERRPALVLAPLRVAQSVWPDEAEKWSHLRDISVSPIIGTEKERKAALARDVSVYTTNYENLPWLTEQYEGKAWPFGIVLADEATRLKNVRPSFHVSTTGKEFVRVAGGKRARGLARVAHKEIRRFVLLTGTPAPNGLADLWGQLWFIDGGQRLGRTYEGFVQRWFKPKYDGYGIEPLPYAREEIQERIKDICLTVKYDGAIEEPVFNTLYVDLPPRAMKLYKQMEKEMFLQLEQTDVEAFNAAARTMKCLQIASGAIYTDDAGTWQEIHSAKLEALDSIIQEAAGMPVLVAYQFKSDLARILKSFRQARVLDKDPQTIRDWNAGKIPILCAHPASAGHGLNLQDGGNILAFFGSDWNLEQYQQIVERIGPVRQAQAGHKRPVFIHHIVARGTVDELVMERRESKREVQDLLLEAMRRRH